MRPSPRTLAIALAIALPAGLPAAASAGSPFEPLQRTATAAKPALGAKASKTLTKRIGKARSLYAHGRTCPALKQLGVVITRTKDGGVVTAARRLQRRLFLKKAARQGACGLRKPTFKVSSAVHPAIRQLPAVQGVPRVVDRLAGAQATTDFVRDELVVRTTDQARLSAFLARWKGKVLEEHGDQHLVRIDAAKADTSGLGDDLRKADPLSRGSFRVSSAKGLDLLAVAADAAAHGLAAAPNILTDGARVLDRSTVESGAVGVPGNAYDIWYNQNASPTFIGTGEAWRTLQIAGKTSNRVLVGIVDGGFSTSGGDLPANVTGADGTQNAMQCSGGNPCPWHGTNVSSTAASPVDNKAGVAGSGGQVADLVMSKIDGGTTFDTIDAIYVAFEAGAKVINISSGYELDAAVSMFNIPIEDATQEARERGALVVASAGNDGRDVDAEDCFVVCWEEEWIAPCENDGVMCVGGIESSGNRASKSNYGYEWCENAQDCDVDIYAPWTTWVAPDPANGTPRQVSGTSFSSPFVAGVAAMVFAAKPSASDEEVEAILRATANSSSDPKVSRVVDADDAVKTALGGDVPPLVEIVKPTGTPSFPYGSFNALGLEARAYDVESEDCCTFVWGSGKDGALGGGASIDAIFGSAGTRTVTATATDKAGNQGHASIDVEATNGAPTAAIVAPAAGATLYKGQPYKLEGKGTDPNEFGGIPCAKLKWEVKLPAQLNYTDLATGCTPSVTFPGTGQRNLRLTVTDADGATDVAVRTIDVVDPPLNAPPLVTILQPDADANLDPNVAVTLKAAANDPDGGAVTTEWSVRVGATTKVIGPGLQRSWKPGDDVPFHCGGRSATLVFSATDDDGTTTQEIPIKVDYPVC